MLVFVKVTMQEFPFLHVFISCFITSLGFGAASNLSPMCVTLKLLHRFCVTWAWCVALTQVLFALYQAERGRVPAAYRGGTIHSPPPPLYSTLEKVEAAAHRRPVVTAAGYVYDTLGQWKRVWSWYLRGIWCQNMMVPILSLSSAADRVQHHRVSIQKIMKGADSSEHSRRNAWQIGEAFEWSSLVWC